MDLAQFSTQLEAYREGMNDHNGCSFPNPSNRTIATMFKAYRAYLAATA